MTEPSAAVVVSGASTGIGAATVELLAREGYVAFAGVRTPADAARLAAVHANVRPIALDVGDRASIDRAVQEIVAAGVPLRGVVSNAGIALGGPLEHIRIDEFRELFEVNVFGALALAQAALPHLPEGRGRIVFVGSISGRLSVPYIGPYSASKFALRALSDALRVELSPVGIAVSLIEAGSVKTPIWAKGREAKDRILATLASTPRAHYRAAVEAVVAQTESEERLGMPVEQVARAIVHALTSAHPRPHYLLGVPARVGSLLALLPPAWRDRAMRAAMRLP
ncbi:MAG: SDR family NAD(P)-dependent oxidoreductase [Candidatus Tumulicola sp.]